MRMQPIMLVVGSSGEVVEVDARTNWEDVRSVITSGAVVRRYVEWNIPASAAVKTSLIIFTR